MQYPTNNRLLAQGINGYSLVWDFASKDWKILHFGEGVYVSHKWGDIKDMFERLCESSLDSSN